MNPADDNQNSFVYNPDPASTTDIPPIPEFTTSVPTDTGVVTPPQTPNTPPATAPVNVVPNPNPTMSEPVAVPPQNTNDQSGKKKKIITAVIIAVLVIGIGAGVYAFRTYQSTNTSAWDCSLYVSSLSPDGKLIVTNGSTRSEPAQIASISLNGAVVTSVEVPALSSGQGISIDTGLTLPQDVSYTWSVKIAECVNSGTNEAKKVLVSCSEVKAYDEDWSVLTANQLSSLKKGDVVRFSVSGDAPSGSFDKARFSINAEEKVEVTDKKPGTDEFYIEYTIPNSVTAFSVSAEIHHSDYGWF